LNFAREQLKSFPKGRGRRHYFLLAFRVNEEISNVWIIGMLDHVKIELNEIRERYVIGSN